MNTSAPARPIELDDTMPSSPTPPAPPLDKLSPDARLDETIRLAREVGIILPDTRLPVGHSLWDVGKEHAKADRKKWARFPRVADGALTHVANFLRAEDRQDFTMPVTNVRLGAKTARFFKDAGTATRDGSENVGLGYSDRAFRQLVDRAGIDLGRGTPTVLLGLDADERAAVVNRRIERMKGPVNKDGKPGTLPNVFVRTKRVGGGRVVRAFLSERYGEVNDLDVAKGLDKVLGGDPTARLDYKAGDDRSSFEVLWANDLPIDTLRVGDLHKAMVLIRNSETGDGSLRIIPAVLRILCANLTTAEGMGVTVSIRHLGDRETLVGQLNAAIRQAAAQVEPLIGLIQQSARVVAPEGPIGDLFGKIGRKAGMTETVVKSWVDTFESRYSGSPTLWGVTSAITEAAQQRDWWVTQAEEEKVASQLMAQRWQYVKA